MATNRPTHTPGPWEVERGSVRYAGQPDRINRFVIGTKKNEHGGRFVTATIEGPFCGDEARHLADARLIAAAPDLLAAAEAAVESMDEYTINGASVGNAANRLRAAIAKARGEAR